MDAEENQKQVFPRRPQPLEIAARFPHSHRRDEAVEVENQKQVFPLSTATGWLFRPNSERRPGGGASLLLQAHCSIRKCSFGRARYDRCMRGKWLLAGGSVILVALAMGSLTRLRHEASEQAPENRKTPAAESPP